MQTIRTAAAALALTTLAASLQAQFVMITDWTADRVMLFNESDGSIANLDFIADGAGNGYDWASPRDALQVGNEIWVSDQVSDSVTRFTTAGVFIANITGGMDNIRGMCFANGKVYVTNAGSGNGAPGDAIIVLNLDGSVATTVSVPDPFDVHEYNGRLLITDIDGDNIGRYDYDLNFIDLFHDSNGADGIDFPQQLNTRSNGNLLAAGFTAPSGLYEYGPDGAQIGTPIPATGARGVHELTNGNLIYTNSSGVHVYDVTAGVSTPIFATGNAQFINRLVQGPQGCGPADVGATGGVAGADGALDNNDFVVFIDLFFAMAPAADLGSTGGVPGADGAWDNNDFVVFIDEFFGGC
ncbi:MAG TPA: GC-type dockerin domain-anchored protein [Phycisphaerales bacterium]|nr:GC-type dockerin domain-anchored protein [Phycisphaerales bacterium]